MAKYHVLIVDNQRRERQELRALLESLGSDLALRDVPSGEEAILLLPRQPVDLLVAEYHLAGMSGAELMAKVRQRCPGVKTIFVSDASHAKIRKQAEESGAEACFFKPLNREAFLQAVRACLDLLPAGETMVAVAVDEAAQAEAPPPPIEKATAPAPPETPPADAEILAQLLSEINATSVMLLKENGEVIAQAGELPGRASGAAMYPALAALLGAGARISTAMGKPAPQNFLYFSGTGFDLFLAQLEHSRALVVLTDPGSPPDLREMVARRLAKAAAALQHGQLAPEAPLATPASAPEPPPAAVESEPVEVHDPNLDKLLKRARRELQTDELNLFWDTAAQESYNETLPKTGELTYDQAHRLGLTPKEEA